MRKIGVLFEQDYYYSSIYLDHLLFIFHAYLYLDNIGPDSGCLVSLSGMLFS